MATYCECGHVWASHLDGTDDELFDFDDEEVTGCTECECEGFVKVPAAELNRGWD